MHAVAIMANPFDSDDDLSTAFGPKTLAERDMVPEGFDNTPRPGPNLPICAISKIWDHGFEYRVNASSAMQRNLSYQSETSLLTTRLRRVSASKAW